MHTGAIASLHVSLVKDILSYLNVLLRHICVALLAMQNLAKITM